MITKNEYLQKQKEYHKKMVNDMVLDLEKEIDDCILNNIKSITSFSKIKFYGIYYRHETTKQKEIFLNAAEILKQKYEENGWEFINIFEDGEFNIGVKIN